MTFSQVCPNCKQPDVVQSVWTSTCLSCAKVFHHKPEQHVPDADPGVDTPVRPGHSLISSAAPTEFTPPPVGAPPAPPTEAPVAEATVEVK